MVIYNALWWFIQDGVGYDSVFESGGVHPFLYGLICFGVGYFFLELDKAFLFSHFNEDGRYIFIELVKPVYSFHGIFPLF